MCQRASAKARAVQTESDACANRSRTSQFTMAACVRTGLACVLAAAPERMRTHMSGRRGTRCRVCVFVRLLDVDVAGWCAGLFVLGERRAPKWSPPFCALCSAATETHTHATHIHTSTHWRRRSRATHANIAHHFSGRAGSPLSPWLSAVCCQNKFKYVYGPPRMNYTHMCWCVGDASTRTDLCKRTTSALDFDGWCVKEGWAAVCHNGLCAPGKCVSGCAFFVRRVFAILFGFFFFSVVALAVINCFQSIMRVRARTVWWARCQELIRLRWGCVCVCVMANRSNQSCGPRTLK